MSADQPPSQPRYQPPYPQPHQPPSPVQPPHPPDPRQQASYQQPQYQQPQYQPGPYQQPPQQQPPYPHGPYQQPPYQQPQAYPPYGAQQSPPGWPRSSRPRPWWVTLGLLGVPDRASAIGFMIVGGGIGVLGLVHGLLTNTRPLWCVLMFLAVAWYWAAVRWNDKHDGWEGRVF